MLWRLLLFYVWYCDGLAHDIPTPYVEALTNFIDGNTRIHKFFFPGHSGGLYIPKSMSNLSDNGKLWAYDLPELDGLDNIHSPTVSIFCAE
jgi:hypothetical protein